MKTIPAAAGVDSATTTLAYIWQIIRRDATEFYFTDHDQAITFGGNEYVPAVAFGSSVFKEAEDNSVDTGEVTAFFDSTMITEADILAGLYDEAEVFVRQVNYNDPDNSEIKVKRGFLGNVSISDTSFTVEFRGMHQVLQQNLGERYANLCTAKLGDARCKVRLDPPIWTASTAETVRPDQDAALGSVVQATTMDKFMHFKATVAGTADVGEPTWPTVVGNTVVDNTVTWEAIQALSYRSAVDAGVNTHRYWRLAVTDTELTGSPLHLRQWNIRTYNNGPSIMDYLQFTIEDALSTTPSTGTLAALFDQNDGADVIWPSEVANITISFPTPIAVPQYYLSGENVPGFSENDPEDFKLQGSDDGVIWVDHDIQVALGGIPDTGITNFNPNTVTSTTPPQRRQVNDNDLANFPDGWFDNGVLEFTAGPNMNIKREVKIHIGSVLEFFEDFPFTPDPADAYFIQTGCAKRLIDCRDKFSNMFNVRGFYHIPGVDQVSSYPNANQ